jgi:hypothetical protein
MGTYVDKLPNPPFDFGEEKYPDNSGGAVTIDLVQQKFDTTMQTAEDMLERLVGSGVGDGGYLGRLYNVIEEYSTPNIGDFTVTIPNISVPTATRPAPEMGNLDLDFPSFDASAPSLASLPTIDTTGLEPAARPDSITVDIDWTESEHVSSLYTNLLSQLITYLQEGSTGLAADVEQALIDRAQARQDIIDDKLERETLEFFASRGFDLPTGVEDAAIAFVAAERARNRTDLNEKILIEQAELAQKNTQFIISAAKDLEAVLRDFTNKTNDRALDAAKAQANTAIALFSENVKAYIAQEQAKLENIKTQVEYLRGVVESNKGLVGMYQAQGDAYKTTIDGKARRNEAVTEVFKAENVGYEAESRSLVAAAGVTIEEYRLRVQNADMQLRKAIAETDASIKGYEAEVGVKARISTDMANIAMQCVASAYGAVNASAGMSYGFSRGKSESFTHGESRDVNYNLGNSLTETHNFKEESGGGS